MSEKPTTVKHPDLSSLPRGAISIRGLPLGRNTRLPSIRSPRDLTLGAQPKRVFKPNIPVRREKKSVETELEKAQTSAVNVKESKQNSLNNKWQKKERNIIQTEGSLFGEGIPASSSRNDRQRESGPRFTGKRSIVKKEFDMAEMKSNIDGILRDDFIDDGEEYDEDDDVKPIIYPCPQNDAEKIKKEETPKKNLKDEEFAKGLGFDVQKIAKFIKKEKCADALVKQADVCMDLESDNVIYNLIKQDKPQLFLLQFPKFFAVEQTEDLQRDSSTEKKKDKIKTGLSVLPEGQIGKFQVLKSGRTRLLIGENSYYLDFSSQIKTKNEVVSIQLNESDKDMIVLGDINYKATIVPDVDKLLESVR